LKQKSKILGEGKHQIDAITSLVIALLLIGLPVPRNIIIELMPWVAVGVAVMLVFFILYGFAAGDISGGGEKSWMMFIVPEKDIVNEQFVLINREMTLVNFTSFS